MIIKLITNNLLINNNQINKYNLKINSNQIIKMQI